jgi:hypothetical protein
MKSMMTNKAMAHRKEQVSIVFKQPGESVESNTIHFHEDWGGEMQSMVEFNPVGVMVIGHGILNYFHAPQIILYTTDSITEESLRTYENKRMKGERRMNLGLTKTIGEGAERPGIGSNQTQGIHSLHNSFQNKAPP